LAIAKRLVKDGAKVMISSRKEKNVQRALETLYQTGCTKNQLRGVVCHVGNKEDRTRLIQQTVTDFGGIDILVSNAAINPVFGPALDVISLRFEIVFRANLNLNRCIIYFNS